MFGLGDTAIGDRAADQELELLELAVVDPRPVETQGAGLGHQVGPLGLRARKLFEQALELLPPLVTVVDIGPRSVDRIGIGVKMSVGIRRRGG